jgi:hypothetical protein
LQDRPGKLSEYSRRHRNNGPLPIDVRHHLGFAQKIGIEKFTVFRSPLGLKTQQAAVSRRRNSKIIDFKAFLPHFFNGSPKQKIVGTQLKRPTVAG